jgi:hypothetical protein
MSLVLVDSSAWIEYFHSSNAINQDKFESLIDNNQICMNQLILSELLPSLIHKKELDVVDILESIQEIPIQIDWIKIIKAQTINIKKGYNNIGIPDLIIMQNAIQNNLSIYSLDKHFKILSKLHGCKLF